MIQSTYDFCLFHINLNNNFSSRNQKSNHIQIDMKTKRKTFFFERKVFSLSDSASDMINMQTNDILMLIDKNFANAKKSDY